MSDEVKNGEVKGANDNEKPKYLEIMLPTRQGGHVIRTCMLKKNVNNRHVRFERGKARITAEGEDRGVRILTVARYRKRCPPTPVDDAAKKLLEKHGKVTEARSAADKHAKAVAKARREDAPKPERPKVSDGPKEFIP